MQYISTRGGMAPKPFSEIVITGLAPDGGLIVPETYPTVSAAELNRWRQLDYRELAYAIIGLYAADIPKLDLKSMIDSTYTAEVFGSDEIVSIKALYDGVYLLGLSHGPTLAFKDMAMQFLGHLFEYVLANSGDCLNILGATSGDTGSSAEYAMRGKHNIKVFMLSPYQKMSAFQTAQMYMLQEPNIFNIAVRGVFDDCQDIVKTVAQDAEFKRQYRIGTVNSINWGRIAAQIVYYFRAYFAVTQDNQETVSMAVPSGNFGNIFAGYIAKRMGLPIDRLILATNENNVLDEFFRTGIYRIRPADQVLKTSSPSMDISKASNFERFIYDLVGCDGAHVTSLWRQLNERGFFDLASRRDEIAQSGFVSGASTHRDRMATIRQIYDDTGAIIDTHTADGVKVALANRKPGVPLVCLETALPAKFEDAIEEALGFKPGRPPGFEDIENKPQRFKVMAVDPIAVKEYIAAHVAD